MSITVNVFKTWFDQKTKYLQKWKTMDLFVRSDIYIAIIKLSSVQKSNKITYNTQKHFWINTFWIAKCPVWEIHSHEHLEIHSYTINI